LIKNKAVCPEIYSQRWLQKTSNVIAKNWSKIGQKLVKNWSKIGQKIGQNRQ
jgi:hypothetical protein